MSRLPISCVDHIFSFFNRCDFCHKTGIDSTVKSFKRYYDWGAHIIEGFICNDCGTAPDDLSEEMLLGDDFSEENFLKYYKIKKSDYVNTVIPPNSVRCGFALVYVINKNNKNSFLLSTSHYESMFILLNKNLKEKDSMYDLKIYASSYPGDGAIVSFTWRVKQED